MHTGLRISSPQAQAFCAIGPDNVEFSTIICEDAQNFVPAAVSLAWADHHVRHSIFYVVVVGVACARDAHKVRRGRAPKKNHRRTLEDRLLFWRMTAARLRAYRTGVSPEVWRRCAGLDNPRACLMQSFVVSTLWYGACYISRERPAVHGPSEISYRLPSLYLWRLLSAGS